MTSPCPRAGGGVHRFLLSLANSCRNRGLSPATTTAVLREETRGCGRNVGEREIETTVRTAFASAGPVRAAGQWSPAKTGWPQPDSQRIAAVVAEGHGLADLWEASPIRLEDNANHAEEILPRLFPSGALLCCGWSQSDFATRPLEEWRGQFARLQFLVPSPMSKPTGLTKDGKLSAHCLDNTGPRRFLVVEFDAGDNDQHSGILLYLARFAPLVLAVHSGGKSLHGWFLVAGHPESKVRGFFEIACKLGADPMTWTRSQFVRCPDGLRENGKRQTVFFQNFKSISIYDESVS